MKRVQVRELTVPQCNYLIAKLNNHQWRYPWMLEQDGYDRWQKSEAAWGSPTRNYHTGGLLLELMKEHKISVQFRNTLDSSRREYVYAEMNCGVDTGHSEGHDQPELAVLRCFINSHHGDDVELPEGML